MCYLFNCTPIVNNSRVASTLWYKHNPNYGKLHVFGATAYLHIPKELRASKFQARSEKLTFVGYGHTGYRLWDRVKKEVITRSDVIIKDQTVVKRDAPANPNLDGRASASNDIENIVINEDSISDDNSVNSNPINIPN